MLQKLYQELSGMSDVRAIIFHTLIDPSIFPAASSESGYGVLHTDLTPKPAYCTLATLRGAGYVCPSTVAPVGGLPAQGLRWTAQDYVQAAVDAARTWYAAHGTYYGLTPAQLHAINPSLSATGADQALLPGPTADPSRIGVWVFGSNPEKLLACNTSQVDRSYCIEARPGNPWIYGSALGSVNQAATATTQGTTWWW